MSEMSDEQHMLTLEGYWFVSSAGFPFISRLKRINGVLFFQWFLMKFPDWQGMADPPWGRDQYESVAFQQYMEGVEVNGMTPEGKGIKWFEGVPVFTRIEYIDGCKYVVFRVPEMTGNPPTPETASSSFQYSFNPSQCVVRMAVLCSCRTFPGSVRALVGRPEPYKRPPGWPG